ncbi:MAG: SLC13/DASS family transporter [Chitinophagaceae bacterium]|nr:SLC13/DASS family transporter [Chitinophagaceae bacterium]
MHKINRRLLSIAAGILIFWGLFLTNPYALDESANKVVAVAALMIIWWITEALPMPVVALLPLVLFPMMGVADMKELASSYANPIIFLFMGGFMIALAIEKWNLHKRGALSIISITGTSGNRIVLGFIIATGLLSMWISNTATTMMMYPIALSVISVMEANGSEGNYKNLSVCLLLAIAYSSNFGGIATIVGTPPNVAYTGFWEKHTGQGIEFADWMKLCLPLSLILLGALYIIMTKVLYPNKIGADGSAKELIKGELKKLGKITPSESRVLIIFVLTALLWITKDFINNGQSMFKLTDPVIALAGGLLMFITPAGLADNRRPLLEWTDTKRLAWGILILFGGGICLAGQLEKVGVIESVGKWTASFATGGITLVFVVAIVSIFISEFMSNVAQVIVFAPVITGMAEALQIDPLQIGIAMTLGASCASMMPMGTPPNAIVFASGKLKLKHMTTTGFVMNMVSAVLITLFCWYLLPVLIKHI